jgi:hypothetical protein
MTITLRDRQEWFHHPVTQDLMRVLSESRQATMENWANFVYDNPEHELLARGGIKVLGQIMELLNDHKMETDLSGMVGVNDHAH